MGKFISSSLMGIIALSIGSSAIVLAPGSAIAEEGTAQVTREPGGPQVAISGDGATAEGGQATAELMELYRSGRAMRTAGIVLDVLGIGFTGLGAGLFIAAAVQNATDHTIEGAFDTLGMTLAGMIWLPVGLVLLAVGTPLWAVGSGRRNRAQRMGYDAASLRPILSLTRGGFCLGMRF